MAFAFTDGANATVYGMTVSTPNLAASTPYLSAIGAVGNATSVLQLVAPVVTFLIPIWRDGFVGDRTIYTHVLTLLNSVLWMLYAAPSLPATLFVLTMNGGGAVIQLIFVLSYIYLAVGQKRKDASIMLAMVVVVSLVMVALVTFEVILTRAWSVRFAAILASASGVLMYGSPVNELVIAFITKRAEWINTVQAASSLLSGAVWTAYARIISHQRVYLGKGPYIPVPNVVGVLCAMVQILVYLIYRKPTGHSKHTDAIDYGVELGKIFCDSEV